MPSQNSVINHLPSRLYVVEPEEACALESADHGDRRQKPAILAVGAARAAHSCTWCPRRQRGKASTSRLAERIQGPSKLPRCPSCATTSSRGSASKGVSMGGGRLLSCTRTAFLPTKEVQLPATSRLKTRSTEPTWMSATLMRPASFRSTSPRSSCLAIAHPCPTRQKRWYVVEMISSSPRRRRSVGMGELWCRPTTGS